MLKYCLSICTILLISTITIRSQEYQVIDTGQDVTYDTLQVIPFPQPGDPFYGQDAQFDGIQFSFENNNDGTVSDLNTGYATG